MRGAREEGADEVAAARARLQVGPGMVLPVASRRRSGRRVFGETFVVSEVAGGEGEGGEKDVGDDNNIKSSSSSYMLPSLPFLAPARPGSPRIGKYELLDYELRAAIEAEEEKEKEGAPAAAEAAAAVTVVEGEQEEAIRVKSSSTSTTSSNVFDISVSASATTGVVFAAPPPHHQASSNDEISKPLADPSSTSATIDALRSLALEAERKCHGGGGGGEGDVAFEAEANQAQAKLLQRRGGGWQMAL